MDQVGSYQAKTHLPHLLQRVARGERITITKHGVPVAMLVPVPEQAKPDRREAIAAMKAFGKGRRLDGLSIRAMIEQGRR
jgi:prevent-host-death family protein